MEPRALLNGVIIPTLTKIALGYSQQDLDIMLGTAWHESAGLRYRHQIGGPALGLWQMEPFTHDDIWDSFLKYRRTLAQRVLQASALMERPHADMLMVNDYYACAMARIKYLRCPEPLPRPKDPGYVDALAAYYVKHYNAGGKATVAEFVAHWKELQDVLAADGS